MRGFARRLDHEAGRLHIARQDALGAATAQGCRECGLRKSQRCSWLCHRRFGKLTQWRAGSESRAFGTPPRTAFYRSGGGGQCKRPVANIAEVRLRLSNCSLAVEGNSRVALESACGLRTGGLAKWKMQRVRLRVWTGLRCPQISGNGKMLNWWRRIAAFVLACAAFQLLLAAGGGRAVHGGEMLSECQALLASAKPTPNPDAVELENSFSTGACWGAFLSIQQFVTLKMEGARSTMLQRLRARGCHARSTHSTFRCLRQGPSRAGKRALHCCRSLGPARSLSMRRQKGPLALRAGSVRGNARCAGF